MLCVQMWHALGAVKKFGYQALDTLDGRSSKAAKTLRMHRGYDVVIAGLPGAVPAFSEAFDCPFDDILALGLPRIDYLLSPDFSAERDRRSHVAAKRLGIECRCEEGGAVVLYAPTLRRGAEGGDEWFAQSVRVLQKAFSSYGMTLVVAGHPLQADVGFDGGGALFLRDFATIDAFNWVDYVVTDYSAVAFEAALVSKIVLFYAPDIEEYRRSPGLNIDPFESYPELAFEDAACLAQAVAYDWAGNGEGIASFETLARNYLGEPEPGCAQRIVAGMRALVDMHSGNVADDDEPMHTAI